MEPSSLKIKGNLGNVLHTQNEIRQLRQTWSSVCVLSLQSGSVWVCEIYIDLKKFLHIILYCRQLYILYRIQFITVFY